MDKITVKTPELLCPAGDLERLKAAVDFGADAVYLAGEEFGMRTAATNFGEEDLKEGMQLEGTVRNVVDFGAFVDIGLKNDGLVHISKICKEFIKHPLEKLNVGDIVTVYVEKVDFKKKQVSLTMIH